MGIRPDLVKRKIESWSELLNPEWKGKTSIVSVPGIGIMDAAMAIEARGDIKYGDKGNMTKAEIDKTIDILKAAKKAGQFRAMWATFDESVNLMAAGETIVQSMWSPAVTAVRSRGIPCYYAPLKEGYRAWGSCIAPMGHLKGSKLDAAYEYINWYSLDGRRASSPSKAIQLRSRGRQEFMSEESMDMVRRQAAKGEIKDPYGNVMGESRFRARWRAFWDRMGKVACWNTLMDENQYMVKKWNDSASDIGLGNRI